MPRKLCWIEVDEEGRAIFSDPSAEATWWYEGAVRQVLADIPDATEEVVEVVADALAMAALTNTEIEPYNATAEARDILTSLASKEKKK